MKRAMAGMGVLVVSALVGYTLLHAGSTEEAMEPTSASPQAFGSAQRHSFAALRGATQPIPHSLQVSLQQFATRR